MFYHSEFWCLFFPNFYLGQYSIFFFEPPMQSYIKILSVRAFAFTPILGYARTVSDLGPDLGHVIIDHCPRAFYSPADNLFCAAILSSILLLQSTKYDARLECYSSRGRFLITTTFANSPPARHTSFKYQAVSYTTSHVLQLAAAIQRQTPYEACLLRLSSEEVCETIAS